MVRRKDSGGVVRDADADENDGEGTGAFAAQPRILGDLGGEPVLRHINCIYVILDAYTISAGHNFNMHVVTISSHRLKIIVFDEKYKIAVLQYFSHERFVPVPLEKVDWPHSF